MHNLLALQLGPLARNAKDHAKDRVWQETLAIIQDIANKEGLLWLINITYQELQTIQISMVIHQFFLNQQGKILQVPMYHAHLVLHRVLHRHKALRNPVVETVRTLAQHARLHVVDSAQAVTTVVVHPVVLVHVVVNARLTV